MNIKLRSNKLSEVLNGFMTLELEVIDYTSLRTVIRNPIILLLNDLYLRNRKTDTHVWVKSN